MACANGCRRAGWYSYDGLDNGGVQCAARIVPELQRVQVGDIFPMTRDETSTRLITRSRGTIDRVALGLMPEVFWHPLDFGMQRRQLLNLKRLVEAA